MITALVMGGGEGAIAQVVAVKWTQRGSNQPASSFYITGRGGLPSRPGDVPLSDYPTGTIQMISDQPTSASSQSNSVQSDS
ncbi:MAG: hypothetical protein WCA35_25410 [Kovacikia sp.]